jgi:glutamyl-tRNA reductase
LQPDAPDLLQFIESYFDIAREVVAPHIYEYRQENAVRHLFRVACSLDSMVIGEPQILGQVKSSYLAARSAGAIQGHLDKVLQRAFVVAKRVRSETQIGNSSVSIASVAVELARKIFGSLEGKKVLLVGAGKMSEQAARHLMNQGAGSVLVANRTHERAEQLAQRFGGRAIRFDDLYSSADQADIIITSTGASRPVFRREHAQHFLQQRRGRPMFFIDIAVPRDVDPEVNKLDGIFLYDIDDLQSVAGSHLKERSREAELAEAMILAEVDKYQRRLHALNVAPEIVRLQQSAEQIRLGEMRRLGSRLQGLSPEQQTAVDALTRSLVNKFLHRPVQAIKAAASEGNAAAVEAIREAFGTSVSTGGENEGEDDPF